MSAVARVGIASGLRVRERHLRLSVRLGPVRGAEMQRVGRTGLAARELGSQQLAEQPVVPVPLVSIVERDEQQVRVFERLQHLGRSRRVEQGIAQRPAQAVDDRRARQELHLVRREAREHFGTQIVRHQAIVTRERETRGRFDAARVQRERAEVQPDRPALGALDQRFDLRVAELHARALEQRA